jgi:hypothetical protein
MTSKHPTLSPYADEHKENFRSCIAQLQGILISTPDDLYFQYKMQITTPVSACIYINQMYYNLTLDLKQF